MPFDPTLYVVDPETGDIKIPARRTLGQYLSQTTSKSSDLGKATSTTILNGTVATGPDDYTYTPPTSNAFPISPDVGVTDGGTIVDPTSNNQPAFVRNQEDLKRFEDAKTLTSDPSLSNTDRQRALYDIDESSGESSPNPASRKISQSISSVLSRNRFTDRRVLVSTNGDPGIQNIPVLNYNDGQMRLGSNENQVDPSSASSSAYRRMRDEGLKILLRASGVEPSENVLDTGAERALVTPESLAGGIVKIPSENMRFTEALQNTTEREDGTGSTHSRRLAFLGNEILDLGAGEEEGVRESQYNAGSYGTLNTYLNPFDGILPISMILNMVILLVASIVAALALGFLLSLLVRASNRVDFAHGEIGTQGSERNPDSIGKGDSVRKFFTDFLGLMRPYDDDYVTLVAKGAASYTGFSDDQINVLKAGGTVPGNVLGSVLSLLGSSGYYVVTSRSIVRNLEILGEGLADIGRQFSTGGGAVSGIESLATFIDILRKSRIVRFVDTLARLGAVQEYQRLNEQKLSNMSPSSDTARSESDAALRVSRSRARENGKTLAWGFREANSSGAYLMPASFMTARKIVVSSDEDIRRLGKDFRLHTNRLGKDEVDTLESKLDAEYVPFYMQDLRTNEILNFHAFIEDLSDSYSPEYTSVAAYGRMDPVQIYKGTTRSISMTFMLVATSREDFDAMWFSINKLTTLVYPEWTKGTEITGAGSSGGSSEVSFIQPFSQVPGSSPLIRLRVGDLIRSNYSRFNLARIFGLGDSSSETGDSQKKNALFFENTSFNDIVVDELPTEPKDPVDDLGGQYKYYFTGQSIEVNAYEGIPLNISALGSTSKPYRILLNSNTELVKDPLAKSDNTIYKLPEGKEIKVSLDGQSKTLNYVKVPVSSVQKVFVKSEKEPSTTSVDSLKNFKGNSIVRSFEAAGGKGLAGVITSLQYTWYDDSTPWETDTNAKAPMMCKVSIQFAPIHDIPMGLDHNGFMRAPAYPVGRHINSLFYNTGSL